jgi:hypothetical protein
LRLNLQLHALALTLLALSAAGCATSRETSTPPPGAVSPPPVATESPSDPRIGLAPGWTNAGEATWNLRVVAEAPLQAPFIDPASPGAFQFINSDLAFKGDIVIQGNFYGIQFWDVSNPAAPRLVSTITCPGSQNDVSVYGDLLFTSVEALNGRIDCGTEGAPDSVSAERMRGIRIFDISDLEHPRPVANVQTCRGSHTHTLVTDAEDPENVYVYVSGSAPVRSPSELAGCSSAPPEEDPNSSLLRIDVIQVPLAAPETARIVSSPRIFAGLTTPETHAEPGDTTTAAPKGVSPDQCHDITVYPAIGLAGGACQGHGFLLDIHDVKNPTRMASVIDQNFSYWHSATFSNSGQTILFTDEWGGGLQPKCRDSDPREWGANAIFTRDGETLTFRGYYKLPVAQTEFENCVAHNGSLIPVPGRDIMVQSWYQGGISVFDFTDPAHPYEIAFFDRGPVDGTKMLPGGSWSAYWYNGYIYSSEIARGLDVLELVPSEHLSRNEIDAAKLIHMDALNVQDQPRLLWPKNSVVAQAYLDQLERSEDLDAATIAQTRQGLESAMGESGAQRVLTLTAIATRLESTADGSGDPQKVRGLADVVRGLMSAGS